LPLFGATSIFAPLIGAGIAFIYYASTYGDVAERQLGYWMTSFGICLVAIMCGWIFAGIGLLRRERYSFLAWLGLFLNSIPILLILYQKISH
jgi:MFS superfamily sulfate permease-like transporter